jgi:hypothetical protein
MTILCRALQNGPQHTGHDSCRAGDNRLIARRGAGGPSEMTCTRCLRMSKPPPSPSTTSFPKFFSDVNKSSTTPSLAPHLPSQLGGFTFLASSLTFFCLGLDTASNLRREFERDFLDALVRLRIAGHAEPTPPDRPGFVGFFVTVAFTYTPCLYFSLRASSRRLFRSKMRVLVAKNIKLHSPNLP